MITFQIKDGVEVTIGSNGAVINLTADSDKSHQVVKGLTITESLAMAQALIQSCMIELKPEIMAMVLKKVKDVKDSRH